MLLRQIEKDYLVHLSHDGMHEVLSWLNFCLPTTPSSMAFSKKLKSMKRETIISIISVLYMQGKGTVFPLYNTLNTLDYRIKDQNVTLEEQTPVFLSCCQHMPSLGYQFVQNKCPVTTYHFCQSNFFNVKKKLNRTTVNRKCWTEWTIRTPLLPSQVTGN